MMVYDMAKLVLGGMGGAMGQKLMKLSDWA